MNAHCFDYSDRWFCPIHSRLYQSIHAATPQIACCSPPSTDGLPASGLAWVQLQNHRFELQVIVAGKTPFVGSSKGLAFRWAAPRLSPALKSPPSSIVQNVGCKSDTSRPAVFSSNGAGVSLLPCAASRFDAAASFRLIPVRASAAFGVERAAAPVQRPNRRTRLTIRQIQGRAFQRQSTAAIQRWHMPGMLDCVLFHLPDRLPFPAGQM